MENGNVNSLAAWLKKKKKIIIIVAVIFALVSVVVTVITALLPSRDNAYNGRNRNLAESETLSEAKMEYVNKRNGERTDFIESIIVAANTYAKTSGKIPVDSKKMELNFINRFVGKGRKDPDGVEYSYSISDMNGLGDEMRIFWEEDGLHKVRLYANARCGDDGVIIREEDKLAVVLLGEQRAVLCADNS